MWEGQRVKLTADLPVVEIDTGVGSECFLPVEEQGSRVEDAHPFYFLIQTHMGVSMEKRLTATGPCTVSSSSARPCIAAAASISS